MTRRQFGENDTGIGLATLKGNTITGFFQAIDIERIGTNPPNSNGPQHITVTVGGALPADNNDVAGPGSTGTGIAF